MLNRLKIVAIASFAFCAMVMPITSTTPAWADSPPKLNKNTDPEILKKYLRKCNGIIAQNKANAEVYATKAQLLEWLKDYKSAINVYSKALNMEPNNTVRLLCRARCYRKRDQYKEALSDYSKAIELGNKSSAAFTGRALSRLLLVQYKEAISDANKAIASNPGEGLAWYVKGSSEAHLGEFKKSLQSLNNAIKINPTDSESLKRRSQVYLKLGDRKKAEQDLALSKKYFGKI